MKKTMELAVLCDLQACTIVVDGDGEVTTWPEDQGEVMKVLEKYGVVPRRSSDGLGNKEEMAPVVPTLMNVDDPLEWDHSVLEDLLKKPWEEILNDVGVGGGINGDFMNIDDYQSLLEEVDTKLKSLTERIELLKSAEDYQSIQTPAPACFLEYHQDQGCSSSSGSSSSTQVPIALPDMPCLFEDFLKQQFGPTYWNLDDFEDIF